MRSTIERISNTAARLIFWTAITLGGLLALFQIFLGAASAQVVDSINVEVVGAPAALEVSGPLRAYVGDTITFDFEVVDDAGVPTLGMVFWEVQPATRATIIAETDSTLTVTLDSRGALTLVATVERLDELAIGALYLDDYREGGEVARPAGTFLWPGITGDLALNVGGRAALCVLGLASGRALFASTPDCAENAGLVTGDLPYRPLYQASIPWAVPNVRLPWQDESIRVGSLVALKNNAPLPSMVRAGVG